MAHDKSDTNKKKMLEALIEYHGVVSDAANKIGIARNTHYEWLKKDDQYKLDCEAAAEAAIDFVEGELYKLIKAQNPAAIIFYMKTKGKNRGYVERQEIDFGGKVNINPIEWIGDEDKQ